MPTDAKECHILFVGVSEERRLSTIVEALQGLDILTVSDMPQFVSRGGMIQFVPMKRTVKFQINLLSARDAGLTMSSELLRVASAVTTERGPAK
jgi:hypothetical protein